MTRTEWLLSRRALESSAGQSAARHYQARSDPRPASPKPSQSCGWETFGWHASWEALEGTIKPSSDSYRSSSLTPLVGGSRSSLPTRSTTGLTWSRYLMETSRGPSHVPAIRGTSASASRNQEKLFENMLDASPSNARSSRTSLTMMSFWPLSQAPRVKIWCES